MKEMLEIERKNRVENAFKLFQERREKQKEQQRKIEREAIEKQNKADEEELEKHFLKTASRLTGKGSALASQRIKKDYVGLLQSEEFKDKVAIDFFKDNMYVWRVKFDLIKYEISKQLKEDFAVLSQKQGVKELEAKLEYEVIFPENYPHEPPFVRVVFPRFAFRTGHVTIGGSICMQSLTPSGWSSARSIESYFVEILSLINAGEARLDTNNTMPYSMQEAKDAFNRVAKDHGWLK